MIICVYCTGYRLCRETGSGTNHGTNNPIMLRTGAPARPFRSTLSVCALPHYCSFRVPCIVLCGAAWRCTQRGAHVYEVSQKGTSVRGCTNCTARTRQSKARARASRGTACPPCVTHRELRRREAANEGRTSDGTRSSVGHTHARNQARTSHTYERALLGEAGRVAAHLYSCASELSL